MPEKDGDEAKSTKSVVNKKQKQMMGEEGYDIARDMGRVRPSKDKKDATTMPVSDEVKKTQKVNKGPSALDIVKKKYKGQIMNVEELDLTQVAEAFGGYIVEAPASTGGGSKKDKKDKEEAERAAETSKKRAEFTKSFEKDPTKASDAEKAALGDVVGRADATKDYGRVASEIDKPGEGPIKGRERFAEFPGAGKVTSYNPRKGERSPKEVATKKQRISDTLKTAKSTDIKGGPSVRRGDPVPQEVRKIKNAAADIDRDAPYQRNTFKGFRDKVKTVTPDKVIPPKGDPLKVNQPQEGPTIDVEKLPNPAKRRKSTFTPPAFATRKGESGGPLPVSMRNRRVRQDRSIVKAEPSEIEKLKPSQKGVQQGGAIVKTQPSEIEKVKPMKKGNIIVRTKVKTGTQDPGIDPEVTTDNPRTRTRTQTGTETAINNIRRFRRGPRGGGGGTDGPGFGKRFGDFMKFTRDNPVASLIGFDAAKSVGKKVLDVLNPKNFGLRGGRVGRRSARQ